MKKLVLLVFVFLFSLSTLPAQSVGRLLKGGSPAPESAPAQGDSLGRDTPSGTVFGFLQVAQSGNDKAAADYLQVSASSAPVAGR